MNWEINFRLDLFWLIVMGIWLCIDWPRAKAWINWLAQTYLQGPPNG